jgi:ELWxxDGT repeat protein
MVGIDGVAYFAADDGQHGLELWRSDGTAIGTSLVRDIHPSGDGFNAFSEPFFCPSEHGLLFVADDGINGKVPWVTDGSAGGTNMIRDLTAPPTRGQEPPQLLVTDGSRVVFLVDRPRGTPDELWVSDGSEAGTVKLTDAPRDFAYVAAIVRDDLFFLTDLADGGTALWAIHLPSSSAHPPSGDGGIRIEYAYDFSCQSILAD